MIRSAFTLIELLVVVTIIVVLLALLTPALDKAIKSAENLRCAANPHSIGIALSLYLNDHKRTFPQTPYFGMLFGNKGLTGFQTVNYEVKQRPLNVYLGHTADGGRVPVAQCPLDQGDALVNSTNAYRDWGNSYIEFTWQDWYRFKKVFGGLTAEGGNPNSIKSTNLKRTDNKALIADWPVFGDRSYSDPRNRWHTEGTGDLDRQYTTLFADMHVQLFTYRRQDIEFPNGKPPVCPAPSPSNEWW